MKRRTALLLIFVAITAFIVYCFIPPTPGVTMANYERLRKGMTLPQVERLMGEYGSPALKSTPLHESYYWRNEDEDFVVLVSFEDATGRADSMGTRPPAPEPSQLRRFLRRLGL
jgi:hypothetical protein